MEEQIEKVDLELYKCKMKSRVKIKFPNDYLYLSRKGNSINFRDAEDLPFYYYLTPYSEFFSAHIKTSIQLES